MEEEKLINSGLTHSFIRAGARTSLINLILLTRLRSIPNLVNKEEIMLDKKKKEKIIEKFKTHPNDTGSSEVQIAILTEEIKLLTKHLKQHRKDFSSRRGLIKKVAQRRRLLRYLERENSESFDKIVKALKINIIKREDKLKDEDFDLPVLEKEESESAKNEEKDKINK